MKATSVLLYQLAMTYCTSSSSETLEKKARLDDGLFLKIKQESDLSVADTEFEDSFYLNRIRFNKELKKLNERRDLLFEEKIDQIVSFLKTFPKNKEFVFSSNAQNPSFDKLVNKLYISGIIERFFQNAQPDLRFLNSVINHGHELKLFRIFNALGFPHSSVYCELLNLLDKTHSKLKKVKVEPKNRLKLDHIENLLLLNEFAIRNSLEQINLEAPIGCKYENHRQCEIQRFTRLFSNLSQINDQFRENFRAYAAEYKKLYGIDDREVKEFLKDNSKVIYYISSAFEIASSINIFLHDLQNSQSKQDELSRAEWVESFFESRATDSDSFKGSPTDYILTDLASNLAIHLLDNDDAIFKQLETGNFSAFIYTAADSAIELSKSSENVVCKPKESQSKED